MTKNLRLWLGLATGAVGALALTACDPYDYSVGGSYSSNSSNSYQDGYNSYGYGAGYGYGNPSFSTTFLVSTGSPRWGYDPYCNSYYDYNRRSYYDPYLYGYYPVGYRPLLVSGVPHPHGYRNNYCPPPSRITNVTLVNYRNRASAYRNTSYSWARQVQQRPTPAPPRGRSASPGSQTGSRQAPYQGRGTDTRQAPYQGRGTETRQAPQQDRGTNTRQAPYQGRGTDTRQNPYQARGTDTRQAPQQGRGSAYTPPPTRQSQGTRGQPIMPGNYNVPVRTQAPAQRAANPRERRQQFTPAPPPQVREQPRMPSPAANLRQQPAARPAPPAGRPASPEGRSGRVRGLGEGRD